MAVDDFNQQAEAIANEWGVDPQLLEKAQYEVESNDTNDGVTVSYFVRFNKDTAREVLNQLGVDPGEFYREVSVNAFDEDDGIYSIDEPLPDISRFIPDDFELPEPPVRNSTSRRAYFIGEGRYTPSQFRRLSRARKIEAMVHWFHENYEDPAAHTPYETREGGYQWIWGGPFDAREQIGDQFSDIAGEDVIEAAAREIEEDGLTEWAPKPSPADYEPHDEQTSAAAHPNYNDSNFMFAESLTLDGQPTRSEESFRSEMLERLDMLESLIRQQATFSPNRGHNNPPEMLPVEHPVTQEQITEVWNAIADIRQEASSTSPHAEVVIRKASLLRRFGLWLADALGNNAVTLIVGSIPIAIQNRQALIDAATNAANAAIAWAQHLPPPF